jgi:hypothetical protein
LGSGKALLLENTASIFEKQGKGSVEEAEAERKQDELYRQVENDFLKKSTGNYTGANRRCRAGTQGTDHSRTMQAFGNHPVGLLVSAEGKVGCRIQPASATPPN